jgi:hypothetical protein
MIEMALGDQQRGRVPLILRQGAAHILRVGSVTRRPNFGPVLPTQDKAPADFPCGKRLKSSRHVRSRVQNNGAHLSSGPD